MVESDQIEVAPPVMTYETRIAPIKHTKLVGDTFKVSCEALGSPQPEIFWFKDGQHIDETVHFQKGKSTVEFSVMGTADGGVYTCRARNLVSAIFAILVLFILCFSLKTFGPWYNFQFKPMLE